MKPIHTIIVEKPIDPGLMWMKHIYNDIMMESIQELKKHLKHLDSSGFKIKPITDMNCVIGYKIEFYNESTLNAYLITKE